MTLTLSMQRISVDGKSLKDCKEGRHRRWILRSWNDRREREFAGDGFERWKRSRAWSEVVTTYEPPCRHSNRKS